MSNRILGIAAGLTIAANGLPAQMVGGGFGGLGSGRGAVNVWYQSFQQAGTMGAAAGGRGAAAPRSTSPQGVSGRPFSATEERKSVQTLGDGTEISTSDSDVFYRDNQGRTRVEETVAGGTMVTIVDPVAHVNITLNIAARTARKTPMIGFTALDSDTLDGLIRLKLTNAGAASNSGNASMTPLPAGGGGRRGGRGGANNIVNEELGVQSQNGVLATGTRTTLTIPKGQIGNNRDIHVVNERWYSEDLQMLVKTLNSDPRFGDNTYELINISRDEPDPALFQIPPDFTITEPAVGRGGRGQVTPTTVINK